MQYPSYFIDRINLTSASDKIIFSSLAIVPNKALWAPKSWEMAFNNMIRGSTVPRNRYSFCLSSWALATQMISLAIHLEKISYLYLLSPVPRGGPLLSSSNEVCPFQAIFIFSSWQGSPSTSSSVHVKWGLGSLKWMRNESVSTYHLPLEAGSDVLYYWIPMPSALQLIGFHASHVLEKMATPLGQFRTTAQFLCFENRGLVWLECALVDTFFFGYLSVVSILGARYTSRERYSNRSTYARHLS